MRWSVWSELQGGPVRVVWFDGRVEKAVPWEPNKEAGPSGGPG